MTQILVLFFLAVIAGSAGLAMRNFARRVRKYADAAASSSIADARGFVEITGLARAASGAPGMNPITGSPCVWYRVVYERDGDMDVPDTTEKSTDPLLLDDGTGVCAIDVDKIGGFPEREVIESYNSGARVLHKIVAGTRLYAIGRIRKLAIPERGATHRLEKDPDMRMVLSFRPLERTAAYLPQMRRISLGALVIAGILLLGSVVSAITMWLRTL